MSASAGRLNDMKQKEKSNNERPDPNSSPKKFPKPSRDHDPALSVPRRRRRLT